ncbi:MAG: hypothetical protein M1830_006903, partial [Pleopsidium flavum]
MQPSNLELLGQAAEGYGDHRPQVSTGAGGVIRSAIDGRRPRSDDPASGGVDMYSFSHYTDSWIEVSSQPSSSSLSSAATDEIVTTGLRLQHDFNARRRRRPRSNAPTSLQLPARPTSAASSSQEEYEESESESDRVLSSSNEFLQPVHPHHSVGLAAAPSQPYSSTSEDASSDDDDGDENSTALGVTNSEPAFTPQPNAFSHPPSSARQPPQVAVPGSYFPAPRLTASRSAPQRHSYPSQRSRHHTPYNMISPSYQADHDAALRASLSTLLSCAAAARGLPKRETVTNRPGTSNRIEPSTLRMVPESIVMGEENTQRTPATARRPSGSSSDRSLPAISTQDKGKRKASTSKDRRAMKKPRRSGTVDELVSPTMMTWVVSAGVVILFSAISFSAGYAMGKE